MIPFSPVSSNREKSIEAQILVQNRWGWMVAQ